MNYRERTKLIDGLCGVFLMALLVEAFYGLADYAFTVYHFSISSVTNVVYILSGIMLVVALAILMIAYKKDNGTAATYGAELLALAITATMIPGTYVSLPYPFNKFNVIFPLAFGIYYLGKAMKLLSNNKANIICMASIESVLALILTYALYNIAKPLFFVGSFIAVITYIISIKKKSKKHLLHGIEIMLVSFLMLVMTSKTAVIFLAIALGIYYMAKTTYMFFNPTSSNKKEKRRK